MKHFIYRISQILCICVMVVIAWIWIYSTIPYANVTKMTFVIGFGVAWSLAILNHFTRPLPADRVSPPWTVRDVVHRASFLLCLVCLGMIPVGYFLEVTERGELLEHHFSGSFVYACFFAWIHNLTRPVSQTKCPPKKDGTAAVFLDSPDIVTQ